VCVAVAAFASSAEAGDDWVQGGVGWTVGPAFSWFDFEQFARDRRDAGVKSFHAVNVSIAPTLYGFGVSSAGHEAFGGLTFNSVASSALGNDRRIHFAWLQSGFVFGYRYRGIMDGLLRPFARTDWLGGQWDYSISSPSLQGQTYGDAYAVLPSAGLEGCFKFFGVGVLGGYEAILYGDVKSKGDLKGRHDDGFNLNQPYLQVYVFLEFGKLAGQ
jgi:hypothetical protein